MQMRFKSGTEQDHARNQKKETEMPDRASGIVQQSRRKPKRENLRVTHYDYEHRVDDMCKGSVAWKVCDIDAVQTR